ncbi:MAG TPA: YobA family protein [Bacillus sp. (in: firmicutes)]|uniref:YobA family protein n=1 Tax=Bacillus litorisediminis TaxID=2922713 RepID=UPI001FAC27D3|nr:YobA family protein [Bacillus litorisediminis]HWO78140.1 YobA family protein [Bacillus sp. (in: firmicutes)]
MLLLIMCYLITGCSDPSIEGYIVRVEDDRVLVAKNLNSNEDYLKIKDIPADEMKMNGLSLIYLGYRDTSRFKEGQKVEVWVDGGINDSSPQQAAAKKIEVIE